MLSYTQQAIHTFIGEHIAAEGMPPSQSEIARAFGFKGVRAAQYHLDALQADGAIERVLGRARGIRVLRPPTLGQAELDFVAAAPRLDSIPHSDDVIRLSVLGRVAAGVPIGADIGSDTTVLLDRVLFSPAPDYLLKVKGDSMRDEGIFDGDLIGVHRTAEARSGQIVVARIDDEVTVKLLKITAERIRLLPRNPDYPAIEIGPDQDFAIEGLYCGLLRPRA